MLRVTDNVLAKTASVKLPYNGARRGFTFRASYVYFRIRRDGVNGGRAYKEPTLSTKEDDSFDFEIDPITLKKKLKTTLGNGDNSKSPPFNKSPGAEKHFTENNFNNSCQGNDLGNKKWDSNYPSFMKPSFGAGPNALRGFKHQNPLNATIKDEHASQTREPSRSGDIFIDDIMVGKTEKSSDKSVESKEPLQTGNPADTTESIKTHNKPNETVDNRAASFRLRRYAGALDKDIDDVLVVKKVIHQSNTDNGAVNHNVNHNTQDFDDHKHSFPCFNAVNEDKLKAETTDTTSKSRQEDGKLHGKSPPKLRKLNKRLLGKDHFDDLIRKPDEKLYGKESQSEKSSGKPLGVEYRNVFAGKEKESPENAILDKNNNQARNYPSYTQNGEEFYTDDLTYEKIFENLPKKSVAQPDSETAPLKNVENKQKESSIEQRLNNRVEKLESIIKLMEKKLDFSNDNGARLSKLEKAIESNVKLPSSSVMANLPDQSSERAEKLLSSQENIEILENLLSDIKRNQQLEKESKFRQVRAYEWSRNKILHPTRTYILPFLIRSKLGNSRSENSMNGYFDSATDNKRHDWSYGKYAELFPSISGEKTLKHRIGRTIKRIFAFVGFSFAGLLAIDMLYPDLLKTEDHLTKYEVTDGYQGKANRGVSN